MFFSKKILCLLSLIALANLLNAQTKGSKLINTNNSEEEEYYEQGSTNQNKRTALIIGNSNYEDNILVNPINDAKELTKVLKKCGFDVIYRTDLKKTNVDSILGYFEDSIAGKGGVNLFYYSGHGLQNNGENYFLPIDAAIANASDIDSEATKLNVVLRKFISAKGGLNIVILDACRTSLPASKLSELKLGLSDINDIPRNTSIFYATSPNKVAFDGVGNNSPFAEALINNINGDTLEFFQIIRKVTREVDKKTLGKQTPTIMGSPTEDFYFKQKVTKSKPNLFIVSLGISDFKGDYYDLAYGKKDAIYFSRVIKSYTFNSGFYNNIFEYVLSDTQVTSSNIKNLIGRVKASAKEGDILLFYYHGYILQNSLNVTFCIPYDGDFENESIRNIDTDTLFCLITDLPCKSLLILDGISGLFPNANMEETLDLDGISILRNKLNHPKNNIAVICSSQKGEFAFESSKWESGLFIYGIDQVMKENVDLNKNDIESFATSLSKLVGNLSNGLQNPAFYVPKGWLNFRLF